MASAQELALITKEGVMAVIGAAKEDAAALECTYGNESSSSQGLISNVKMATGNHTMVVDEPVDMPGGQNKGQVGATASLRLIESTKMILRLGSGSEFEGEFDE